MGRASELTEANAAARVIGEEIAPGADFDLRPVVALERFQHATAREKLHSFLQVRPAGADARELMGLLFKGGGIGPRTGRAFYTRAYRRRPQFRLRRVERIVVDPPKRVIAG